MRGSKSTYNPELVELFFKRLEQLNGHIGLTCKRLGMSKTTPHDWKRNHPEFAKRFDEVRKK